MAWPPHAIGHRPHRSSGRSVLPSAGRCLGLDSNRLGTPRDGGTWSLVPRRTGERRGRKWQAKMEPPSFCNPSSVCFQKFIKVRSCVRFGIIGIISIISILRQFAPMLPVAHLSEACRGPRVRCLRDRPAPRPTHNNQKWRQPETAGNIHMEPPGVSPLLPAMEPIGWVWIASPQRSGF